MVESIKKGSYDVIVVGGGIAGICSAVAAARENKKVLLLERQINLGGLATIGLISWFEPLCDGAEKQMVHGIGEELFWLAINGGYDNLHPLWGGKTNNKFTYDRFASFYSPAFFSLNLDKFLRENGVEILYDTMATYPEMEGNICKGITVENIDGRSFYECKVIIDCTGSASIAQRAGIPTITVDNVQTYLLHDTDREKAKDFAERGDMTVLRHWQWFKAGQELLNDITIEKENEYIANCKEIARQQYVGTDKNEREIMSLPQMPQIRIIRNIVGETTFMGAEEDRDKPVADSIGSMGDFLHRDYRFDIPYGCIYNRDFPNILCAGRIVSARGNGISVLRVIPGCAVTGQAAGIAAAVAVEKRESVANVYADVKERLVKRGVAFKI